MKQGDLPVYNDKEEEQEEEEQEEEKEQEAAEEEKEMWRGRVAENLRAG